MQPSQRSTPEPTAELVRLERPTDGRLIAHHEGKSTPVRPIRCFPWSRPGSYISLRDDEEKEIALVVSPADLDPSSRAILEQALAEAGFVLHITRIVSIEEELEIRAWKVETREGPRTFQTARDEWPRPLPGGSILLRDVAGDLYLAPPGPDLDPRSRRALWAFID